MDHLGGGPFAAAPSEPASHRPAKPAKPAATAAFVALAHTASRIRDTRAALATALAATLTDCTRNGQACQGHHKPAHLWVWAVGAFLWRRRVWRAWEQ